MIKTVKLKGNAFKLQKTENPKSNMLIAKAKQFPEIQFSAKRKSKQDSVNLLPIVSETNEQNDTCFSDFKKVKWTQCNSDRKTKSILKETSSNFTFKCDEELSPCPQPLHSKPTLISMTDENLGNSFGRHSIENFVPRENYEELCKMYRILQLELNKTFEALLEFKSFDEKHAKLLKEHDELRLKFEESKQSKDFVAAKEVEVLKMQNENLKNKNKKLKKDMQELNNKFEKGIDKLKDQLMNSNLELENENEQLRSKNSELKIKCSSFILLENQLKKATNDFEIEKQKLIDEIAVLQTSKSEFKSFLKRILQRNSN